ncbi:HAMP domain-containing sensor histidine kinase [Actinoplanes sp. NBRC 103695]|uniref:sensor histidine kinase n=1 Tax=Actinoplanes sp. NBRC 103695 TaxID=3032202 RepID=UPI0024A16492|nr:HAMP domain-containing sensor histidine kinase [Actinoplanes sp. NBRC 103695]GLZ01109.1 two-component sensor histidine kinase [Actinoplanes sp. NBRC 103695]
MRSQSLVGRLLAMSLLVMLCAVLATTWLVVNSTTSQLRQELGQGIAYDARIYEAVLEYAAEHTTWSGAQPMLAELSGLTGRQITLTGEDGTFLASSEGKRPDLPARRSALVNPLQVEGFLASDESDANGIYKRAFGPYRLTAAEHRMLSGRFIRAEECMTEQGIAAGAGTFTAGRPTLAPLFTSADLVSAQLADCYRKSGADVVTDTERAALAQLTALTNACLVGAAAEPVVTVLPGFAWKPARQARLDPGQPQECIIQSRRKQLAPYVAPPAYLYVAGPDRQAGTVFDLSRAGTSRVATVAGLVLAVAFAVTLLVGLRISRPLRALTHAVESGASDLPVRGRDEIGRLTAAFNDLSERRETVERQRRAMISDIAHELGSPLTNIRAWLQAARDGVAEPGPELLDLLVDEAELLQHVIGDLSDLADADAGRLRLHPELVYVNELLGQVAAAHAGRADGVSIEVEAAGDPEVMLDPNRIRQVVGNLLSNAVRHSPPGATVTVRSRLDGGYLVIEVADTGQGIAEDDLPYIFDRFWRADKSRNRSTGGSGLGLAIVRKLAEAHGGTVTATSRLGHGSTFTLRLPT